MHRESDKKTMEDRFDIQFGEL